MKNIRIMAALATALALAGCGGAAPSTSRSSGSRMLAARTEPGLGA